MAQKSKKHSPHRSGGKNPGARRTEDKPGTRRAERNPGTRRAEDKPGTRRAEKNPGARRTEDKPGTRRAEKNPGARRTEDKPGTHRAEKKDPFSLSGRKRRQTVKRAGDEQTEPVTGSRGKKNTTKASGFSFPPPTGKFSKKMDAQSESSTFRRPTAKSTKNTNEKKKETRPAASFKSKTSESSTIRLNKYIAHAGICSRRDADRFITDGEVQVNGAVCRELGTLVRMSDRVSIRGQLIEPEPFVYYLMNKPRDTITTTKDEKGRKTVMDLVEEATGLRVYPVGRLDRNTTGLLLLTNDGDLANRLMHPSYKIHKVYEVQTSRELAEEDLQQLRTGILLDDGLAKAYRVSRHPGFSNVVRLSLQEGRNRMVRRMMEALGFEVAKLDRIAYGPLRKDGLRPGRWRNLKNREINALRKMVRLLPLEHPQRS